MDDGVEDYVVLRQRLHDESMEEAGVPAAARRRRRRRPLPADKRPDQPPLGLDVPDPVRDPMEGSRYEAQELPRVVDGLIVPAVSAIRFIMVEAKARGLDSDGRDSASYAPVENVASHYVTSAVLGVWFKTGARYGLLWAGLDPEDRGRALASFVQSWGSWRQNYR